ncbi:hypothetical protein DC082_10285 [Ignatzschineria indica]|uniref:Transposase DDE domain-containing protein n=1 Tax=Ignatzschineria indica TaxID=472583 RepID=A0A2U2AHT8_9GAMM|nr:hypothetical protein DC082_10285 [Ignatzschineria indica]
MFILNRKCKQRSLFLQLKHFRGLATRYDKLKSSYSSNVALACAYVWLKP